ncbi:hypothetical protein [Telluribacter humicola]|uniref:hypothetical protein n=1 Tax=Telluribacter humicola TaxID=1720261 RepID=UPI001A96C26A|nr:hypothetical protein [Telluribacter humicola]
MSELVQDEKATVKDLTIHRNSWWMSADGSREFVVVGIGYASSDRGFMPEHYSVLERGSLLPYPVACQLWKDQVKAGKIRQVLHRREGGEG